MRWALTIVFFSLECKLEIINIPFPFVLVILTSQWIHRLWWQKPIKSTKASSRQLLYPFSPCTLCGFSAYQTRSSVLRCQTPSPRPKFPIIVSRPQILSSTLSLTHTSFIPMTSLILLQFKISQHFQWVFHDNFSTDVCCTRNYFPLYYICWDPFSKISKLLKS